MVQPAALMPLYAIEGGSKLVIINMDNTPYDRDADLTLHGKAGELMERILDRVKEKIG